MTKKIIILNCSAAILVLIGTFILIGIIRSQRLAVTSTPPVPSPHVRTASVAPPVVSTTAPTTYVRPVPTNGIGLPTSINIPSLGLFVSVIPGYYNASTQQWTLTHSHAQYATSTALPSTQGGNTFIYGHALNSIFGLLPRIQQGATAIVRTDNGHSYFYHMTAVSTVSPDQSREVFSTQTQPMLTLQTCTGILYQNRQLFSFSLDRVI